jgi:uncharacterized sulfatase
MRKLPHLVIAASTLTLAFTAIPSSARNNGATPAPAPAAAPQQQPAARDTRPNIVVFIADDLGFGDTGAYGDPNANTPAFDRLAASGMSFNEAFVASPACAPSRAAMLTGLMPARNGAEANQAAPRRDIRKLPSYLQELGYEVVAFGKVGHYVQTRNYGFDLVEHDGYHDPQATLSADRWLRMRKSDKPLAIFVGSNWPHVPWPDGPEGYNAQQLKLGAKMVDTPETRDLRSRYYAAVSRMDQELGNTLSAVDETLGKNTIVLFSSDHGAQWPFGKWNLYDTGTRVPLIVRWNGVVKPGTKTGAMVSWVDILPTLIDVAGGKPPETIDGRSFAPLLRGNPAYKGRSEIFTTHNNDGDVNVYPMRSVRTERWKYIRNLHPEYTYTTHIDQYVNRKSDSGMYFPSWRRAADSDAKAKAIVDSYYKRPAEELYDLQADPNELHNLAGDARHAAVLKDMRNRLSSWRTAQGDTREAQGKPHFERGPLLGQPRD